MDRDQLPGQDARIDAADLGEAQQAHPTMPVTIRPMASMWAESSMRGRGSGAVPRRKPCRLPRRLMVSSSTSGRQASAITLRTGASWPERPGKESNCLRNGVISVMCVLGSMVQRMVTGSRPEIQAGWAAWGEGKGGVSVGGGGVAVAVGGGRVAVGVKVEVGV